jgi:hypothetical protein
MKLFTITENFEVELNKEWIYLIPEFAALMRRDKRGGTKGDARGDKKLRARKEFKFIYFDLDFSSPIRDYPDYERRQEALKYAELIEKDLDDLVMEAHACYNNLMLNATRSLKTLRAVKKSLDALDNYFEDLDFTKVDKKGELLHNPNSYLVNLERLDKAYTSVEKFEKRVIDELKNTGSIRGTATLGEMEGKRKDWSEAVSRKSEDTDMSERIEPTSMMDLAKIIHGVVKDGEE